MYGGLLIVISGPSGSGKGSLVKRLLERNKEMAFSVSATTRQPRRGEVNGRHYYFKTLSEFKSMIESNEMLEWVEYCDNYYGTPAKGIFEQLSRGQDVILEIDVEGAMKVKERCPDSVLVFILPPGFPELRKRIEMRGTERGRILERRLMHASREIKYVKEYDYLIMNSNLFTAVKDMEAVIRAEKLKTKKNNDLIKQFEKQLTGVVIKND